MTFSRVKFRNRPSTDLLVVHCAATRPDQDIGVEEIHRWHQKRGFVAVGYHAVIRRDGTIECGRPEWAMGAHARGFNSRSVGVCLVGGVDDAGEPANNFTIAQLRSLRLFVNEWRRSFPEIEVLGHRDLPKVRKACPCFDVKRWDQLFLEEDGK